MAQNETTKSQYHTQHNVFWQLFKQNVKNVKDAFVAHGTFEQKFKFACEIVSQNSISMDEQRISPPPHQNQTVNVEKNCKKQM